MNLSNKKKAYLQLHLAVLLFGFTAILGDLIQLPALTMVWWRVFITSISLVLLINVGKLFVNLPRKTFITFSVIGVLVGCHWICFYGAIKLSNASIALVCMATTSFFTALIEPIALKESIKGHELLLGLIMIPGMALIVSDLEMNMMNGVWVGLLSAAFAATFSVLNKKYIGEADEMSITFIELGSACLFISILLFGIQNVTELELTFWPPSTSDWIFIIILALLCTTFAYILALKSLNHLSAFTSNLTINLEPLYGIILAWLMLNENQELSPSFYWGVSIILMVVFAHPLIQHLKRQDTLRKARG